MLGPLAEQQWSCPAVVMDGEGGSVPAMKTPPGEVCPLEDKQPVETTLSNDRGKGRPIGVLQGFTLDEGKSVKTGAEETQHFVLLT